MVVDEDNPDRIVLQGKFQEAARVDRNPVNGSLGKGFNGGDLVLSGQKDTQKPLTSLAREPMSAIIQHGLSGVEDRLALDL